MRKTVMFGLLLLFSLNLCSAAYISGEIHLYDDGSAQVNLETDTATEIQGLPLQDNKIQGLTSEVLNYKDGTWTLNLNLSSYEDIFIDIYLPKNLDSITSISGTERIIDIENKVITLIDSGKLDFSLSYKTKKSANLSWIIWPVIILLIVLTYFFYKKSRKKKEHLKHIMPLVNENEERILGILMKSPKRQNELRKSLGIPKASFSRYLVNLEKKKLIFREGEGKNKVVKLK